MLRTYTRPGWLLGDITPFYSTHRKGVQGDESWTHSAPRALQWWLWLIIWGDLTKCACSALSHLLGEWGYLKESVFSATHPSNTEVSPDPRLPWLQEPLSPVCVFIYQAFWPSHQIVYSKQNFTGNWGDPPLDSFVLFWAVRVEGLLNVWAAPSL